MRILLLLALVISIPSYSRTIVLTSTNFASVVGIIDMNSVTKVGEKLQEICIDEKKEVFLVLNTAGGMVGPTSQLIELARGLPCKINTITIAANSCGYFLAQSFNR